MNNTIPFKSTSRTIRSEQITVDVSILSVLNHAASPGRRELDSNIYLAAIAPDMELNIIMEEDAPHILPCFDEEGCHHRHQGCAAVHQLQSGAGADACGQALSDGRSHFLPHGQQQPHCFADGGGCLPLPELSGDAECHAGGRRSGAGLYLH